MACAALRFVQAKEACPEGTRLFQARGEEGRPNAAPAGYGRHGRLASHADRGAAEEARCHCPGDARFTMVPLMRNYRVQCRIRGVASRWPMDDAESNGARRTIPSSRVRRTGRGHPRGRLNETKVQRSGRLQTVAPLLVLENPINRASPAGRFAPPAAVVPHEWNYLDLALQGEWPATVELVCRRSPRNVGQPLDMTH
jgi:hypothetical protein